ncbi:MAG: 2Fe-2S iron-sulfur cluster-binding protein [Cyclobacteriaceae bacterium]
MARIIISNLKNKEIKVSDKQSVLSAFQDQFIDWMHACGGKGRCTTCAFNVIEGSDALSPPTPAEVRFRDRGRLREDQRLACQVRCLGKGIIEVPNENQLPHLSYGYE